MRDEDNINALERCKGYLTDDCIECPYVEKYPRCYNFLKKYIIDLINRQREEIERLEKEKDSKLVMCIANDKDKIKSEAIKDFSERLKEKLQWDVEFDNKLVFESDIDSLVKEMTEVEVNQRKEDEGK